MLSTINGQPVYLQNLNAYQIQPEFMVQNLNELNLQNLGQSQAQGKQDDLWTKITKDSTSRKWPGIGLAEIFVEKMKTSFTTKGDEMPK